jgi:hypothetical protein
MNAKRLLLVVGAIVLGVLLFVAGTAFAQTMNGDHGWWMHDDAGRGWQRGPMHDESGRRHDPYGMMDSYGEDGAFGGMMGPAMMGGWGGLADVEPLTIEEAEAAVEAYLSGVEDEDLAVGEVMIFDNHAYAQVIQADGGAGAFEVLVDPLTGDVYPEPGPNMMWNTAYGHGAGGMMGMMGGAYGGMMGAAGAGDEAEVDADEAVRLAQAYLDEFLPGATADEHADAFPGYYTLHVLRDGEIVGMLSVRAAGGDVFPHTWHGDFVTLSADHAE